MHYCGHLLVLVRVNAPSKRCLGESGMKACSDKQLTVKVKTRIKAPPFHSRLKTFVFAVAPVVFAEHSFTQQAIFSVERLLGRAPPDLPVSNVPAFIKKPGLPYLIFIDRLFFTR